MHILRKSIHFLRKSIHFLRTAYEEVEDLTLRPQEHTVHLRKNNLIVYRLGFSETIRTKEGKSKQILIELQKAKFPTDIMRFRNKEYSNPKNVIEVEKVEAEKTDLLG